MVVCSNRKIAYALLQKFKDKYPEWFEEKKSPDGVSVTEEELKELKPMPFMAMVSSVGSNDEKDMYDYLGGVKNDKRSEELDAAFKQEKSNFSIVIVVDMWITGFDVPCLTYLYNDKPLKKHLLIQTISRVNRKYPGKEYGMVIDYIGIRDNMREAMKVYGGDTSVAPTSDDVEQATSVFREELEVLKNMFTGYDLSPFLNPECDPIERYRLLAKAAEYVFVSTEELQSEGNKGVQKVSFKTYFLKTVKRMRAAFDICQPSGYLGEEESALAQCFMAIAGFVRKMSGTSEVDTDTMNRAVSKMVEEALKYNQVESVLESGEEEDIFSPEYFEKLSDIKMPATKLELLVKMLRKQIKEYGKVNQLAAKSFQEMLEKTIAEYHGEYDSYNIEHRNYTVIQGKSESPLAKYIAENINRYANEYLKNCNGYIEDSEDVAIKFINDENVLGDIQEKYVNVLKTVISDISVIQNKKLWNEMLDKRIIKKTVPNIIHYYTEYCCDSQLIKFINECDAGMDYSHIENEFGGEIARQFFDSVAVNNEIKTSRYQEILCNMGYGYDVYDTYDISDDKMEVLIKKDVIEMNNVGLEYIRNHYKKYTALYIDENIEAYLRIITSDNFSYEEALHILGMEIGDKEKIDLLGLTTEPISVVGKGYSSSLIKYILDNNFDEHDENELYQHFSEYEEVIQSSIYRVAKSRIANIIDNSTIVLDDNLLSKLLTMSKCSMDDKIQLWAKALPNLTEETCKKHFDELGFPELKGIFTKRNNYTKTYEDNSFIRDILYMLKKNTWIFDYYKKSDDEGYVVVKNPIKDKRY